MTKKGDLRTILNGVLLEMFKELKEYYGLKNNTEMLRLLIKKEHDKLRKIGEI